MRQVKQSIWIQYGNALCIIQINLNIANNKKPPKIINFYLRIIQKQTIRPDRSQMEQKIAYLLNRSQPFTEQRVQILDQLTTAIYSNSPQAKEAHEIWRRLKQDDYFWYFSDKILEKSQVNETKVFILVILQQAIKQKWFALPQEQRESLKSYIVNVVLEYGAIENISKPLHNILSKANSVLVQIVKYEWNTTWTSFINDICSASLKDMNICENNFSILKMLSQQIFDYSKNQMTQSQISTLKQQMVKDFTTIFQLCRLILDNIEQAKQSLVRSCLQTLHAFLSWIPMYYIIYTNLIDNLIKILQSEQLRSYAMSCLVEIAGLKLESKNMDQINKYVYMLKQVTIQLNKILPLTMDKDEIAKLKKNAKKRWVIFEVLSRNITMFYSQFFKQQNQWLNSYIQASTNEMNPMGNINMNMNGQQNNQLIQICTAGFNYMLMIMRIDDDQVFKICIQFFHFYIGNYLQKQSEAKFQVSQALQYTYRQIFLQVMKIISLKMAKPEQVLIVIDEDGLPVRQEVLNTQNSSLYEIMKELAAFLVKVDWPQMKKFIINQIQAQQNNDNFSFEALNSLSWMVGSLCGSILEKEQKNFFISSLRTLLHLCENKKGKQNKAVIASCIMYVVGQYPTFLRNNWTFLKTVVKKLFQFMRQQFPGIMQMACNAFLKIVKSTADQFVISQSADKQPFVRQIIRRIPQQTQKLNSDTLRLIFFQALGYLIGAQKDTQTQVQLTKEALGLTLFEFQKIIETAQTNPNVLLEQQIKRKLLFFLKLNETLATGIGQQYALFLQNISQVINKLYLYYSQQIAQAVQKQGKACLNFVVIKSMRAIKKQVIKIYIRYLEKCNDLNSQQADYILTNFIFPLGTLLKDFQTCIAETKEQQFVALFTVVLTKLYMVIKPEFLSTLVGMIFGSSLPLITTDFNSFPQIRSNFFSFLKALVKYNFGMLYSLDQSKFNLILDCVIWSLRHELSTYSDLGLDLLEQIIVNVNTNQQIMNAFYPKYHIKLLTDILDVMTDGFHKSGLESQTKIFYLLIQVAKSSIIKSPISPNQSVSNAEYLYNFLNEKLVQAFPNTSKSVTQQKVGNWFKIDDQQQFKNQVGDYLVLINRYTPNQIQESSNQNPNNANINGNNEKKM